MKRTRSDIIVCNEEEYQQLITADAEVEFSHETVEEVCLSKFEDVMSWREIEDDLIFAFYGELSSITYNALSGNFLNYLATEYAVYIVTDHMRNSRVVIDLVY